MAIDLAKCCHYRIFSSSGNVPQFSFLFLNNGNLKILCTVTFLILFLMISSESHYKCIRQSNVNLYGNIFPKSGAKIKFDLNLINT